MNKFLLLFILLFSSLLVVNLVSANLVISTPPLLSCTWYIPCSQTISLWNNNSVWSNVTNTTVLSNVSLVNITFSPLTFYNFPSSVDLLPNESKTVSVGVLTNDLFSNRISVSTVSFFYSVPIAPVPKTYEINVSSNGFSSFPVLMVGDSFSWHNVGNVSVTLRDLSSGFQEVTNLGVGAVLNRSYLVAKNFSFYIASSGVAGTFQVLPRSGVSYAHDSDANVPVSFRLSSVLPASTMQITLLTENLSIDNNATYKEALIEVRNLDPNLVIQNVNISSDRWTSSFSPNLFNLPAGGVQRVLFNITPFVDKTNLTNRSSKIILNVKSDNAGSTVKDIDVFIKYQNMDVVVINGVNYTIVMMNWNATLEACNQHMNDVGFETCRDFANRWGKNVTIIKEIPASYDFTEAQVKTYADSWATLSGVAQRLENKQNSYLDKQSATNLKVDNLTSTLTTFQQYVNAREIERDKVVQNHNLRFWLIFSFALFFFLANLIVKLLANIELFDALERAGQ